MEVKQFFELLNEIKYVADYDEIIGSDLRAMISKYYSVFKEIYNGLCNTGVLEESKKFTMKLTESDVNYIVMEATKRIVEAHGAKKHNMPKDKDAARRKGNRDAARDINGDGFKSNGKVIKKDVYSRKGKGNKVNINDINVDECVKKSLSEFNNHWQIQDYEGNDLNYESIYDQAITIITQMEKENLPINWSAVAERMGFHMNTFNESDMETLHDAIEDAMLDCHYDDNVDNTFDVISFLKSKGFKQVNSEDPADYATKEGFYLTIHYNNNEFFVYYASANDEENIHNFIDKLFDEIEKNKPSFDFTVLANSSLDDVWYENGQMVSDTCAVFEYDPDGEYPLMWHD